MDDAQGSTDARIDELLGVVAALTAKVEALEATVAARPAPTPPVDATVPTGPVGRRQLLFGGGVAAAAATATVVLGSSAPAAAANGSALTLGVDTNMATATTKATTSAPALGAGIEVDHTGAGPAVLGQSSAGAGVTGTSSESHGVFGESTAEAEVAGVRGNGRIWGVWGHSTEGSGVYGTALSSAAVVGESEGWVGLSGFGPHAGLVVRSSRAQMWLYTDAGRAAPTGDLGNHEPGEVVVDGTGTLWVCVAKGTPGTWRKVAGTTTAGSFHLLPTPVRVYDSRPGTTPAVGTKAQLSGNTGRSLSVTANSSGVPLGATAVAVTLLLVNASSAGGNFTIWAGGTARPAANAMVWGGTAGRFASTATTRISADGKVNVAASAPTDLALDVVGYYL